jgi:hypothetical protein
MPGCRFTNMKSFGLIVLFALACFADGCSYGMTAKKFPPALGPRGVTMRVVTEQRVASGELLEVRDTGIVVLADQKVALLPYSSIVRANAEGISSGLEIEGRRNPDPEVRERLRLLSHFPQGLSPPLLQELLNKYGQTSLAGENP